MPGDTVRSEETIRLVRAGVAGTAAWADAQFEMCRPERQLISGLCKSSTQQQTLAGR